MNKTSGIMIVAGLLILSLIAMFYFGFSQDENAAKAIADAKEKAAELAKQVTEKTKQENLQNQTNEIINPEQPTPSYIICQTGYYFDGDGCIKRQCQFWCQHWSNDKHNYEYGDEQLQTDAKKASAQQVCGTEPVSLYYNALEYGCACWDCG